MKLELKDTLTLKYSGSIGSENNKSRSKETRVEKRRIFYRRTVDKRGILQQENSEIAASRH